MRDSSSHDENAGYKHVGNFMKAESKYGAGWEQMPVCVLPLII
jgi:hypothetical protein